jgi:hypothetical protein
MRFSCSISLKSLLQSDATAALQLVPAAPLAADITHMWEPAHCEAVVDGKTSIKLTLLM